MKLAWLNDFKLKEFTGGCQITNSIMIKKGKGLGYEITEMVPTGTNTYIGRIPTAEEADNVDKAFYELQIKELEKVDLVILNNINMFKPDIIKWIIKNKKYITYTHDYYFCKNRNAKCKPKCVPAKIFQDIYSNSLLNIFLSPLHLNTHKKFFGEMMRDAIYIPSPLEEGKFSPDLVNQQDAYLYAGTIMNHKGVSQILDFADSQNGKIFHFAGKAVNKELMDRIKDKHLYLGEIPYDEMPKLMRKYKYFIINPQWSEPFGRSVIEAINAGCILTRFSQTWETGLESYNLSPESMIKKCINAPNVFWSKIKGEVK